MMATARKKNIITILFIVLAMAAFAGWYAYNRGPVDVAGADAIETTAASLYQPFISDSASAQKQYSGRVIAVTGIVSQVQRNQSGLPVILLITSPGQGFINCTAETNSFPPLKVNESVSIKGICSGLGSGDEDLGLLPDLYLERCILQP